MIKKISLFLGVFLLCVSSLQANKLKIIDEFSRDASSSIKNEINSDLLRGLFGYSSTGAKHNLSAEAIDYVAPRLANMLVNMPWLTHINLSGFPEAALSGEFMLLNATPIPIPLACTTLSLTYCHLTQLNMNFSSLGRLTHLDLSHNQLPIIPPNLNYTQLDHVDLRGNPIKLLPDIITSQECRTAFIFDTPLRLTEISPSQYDFAYTKMRLTENHIKALIFKHLNRLHTCHDIHRKSIIENFLIDAPPEAMRSLWIALSEGYLGCYQEGNLTLRRPLHPTAKTYITNNLDRLGEHITWLKAVFLEDVPISILPPKFLELAELRILRLENCDIQKLPKGIKDLKNLEILSLVNNPLEELPIELNELTRLTSLVIPSHSLSAPPQLRELLEKVSPKTKLHHENWFRRDIVQNFLKDAPAELKEKEVEILEGLLGTMILDTGIIHPRCWTDLENAFLRARLDQLDQLYWLTKLNLSGMKLRTIPKSVLKLKKLKYLTLENNWLDDLPDELAALEQLEGLSLRKNRLHHVPEIILELPDLIYLDLAQNHIRKFVITRANAFAKLTTLHLGDNLIDFFETANSALNPREILLYQNRLSTFTCEIDQFTSLKSLHLAYNQLAEFPIHAALLPSLNFLALDHNFIPYIPDTFEEEDHEVVITLNGNPNLTFQTTDFLEDNIDFDRYTPFCCEVLLVGSAPPDEELERHACRTGSYINEETFMDEYESWENRWNIETLRRIKLSALPPQEITPNIVLTDWTTLWNSINFDDATNTDTYQDFEFYEPYLKSTQKAVPETGSNLEKMKIGILPHLNGYIKTLFDLKLDEDETAGWQIEATEKPIIQQYTAYLIKEIKGSQNLALFTQFVIAILVCPTGQKTAFETMMLNTRKDTDGRVENMENLETLIKKLFATEKEKAFYTAINQPKPNDSQEDHSVHLIEHYRKQLCDRLGLANQMSSYRDIYAVPREEDLFHGNNVKAMQAFYQTFRSDIFIDKLYSLTETADDRELKNKGVRSAADHEDIRQAAKARPITIASLISFLHEKGVAPQGDYLKPASEGPFPWQNYFSANPVELDRVEIRRAVYTTILEEMELLHKEAGNDNISSSNSQDNAETIIDAFAGNSESEFDEAELDCTGSQRQSSQDDDSSEWTD